MTFFFPWMSTATNYTIEDPLQPLIYVGYQRCLKVSLISLFFPLSVLRSKLEVNILLCEYTFHLYIRAFGLVGIQCRALLFLQTPKSIKRLWKKWTCQFLFAAELICFRWYTQSDCVKNGVAKSELEKRGPWVMGFCSFSQKVNLLFLYRESIKVRERARDDIDLIPYIRHTQSMYAWKKKSQLNSIQIVW